MRALNNMAARKHVSLLQTEQCKLQVRTVPKPLLYGHSSQTNMSCHGWQRRLPKHHTSICVTQMRYMHFPQISKAIQPCAAWGASQHATCFTRCLCISTGICPHKKIVCLVVDECHRAKGNSDIVLAVKKLRQDKCKFRVLGLSATPGSSNEAIQVSPCLDTLTAHALMMPFRYTTQTYESACSLLQLLLPKLALNGRHMQ